MYKLMYRAGLPVANARNTLRGEAITFVNTCATRKPTKPQWQQTPARQHLRNGRKELKLGMRLQLRPRDDCFNVAVRLTGRNVHVVLELQQLRM